MNKVILFLLCLISTMYMAAQMQSPVGVTWQLDSSDMANRTYRCHFTMENKTGKRLAQDWTFYFNTFPRMMTPDENSQVKICEVRPGYYKIIPQKGFSLAASEKIDICYTVKGIIKSISYAPDGGHFAFKGDTTAYPVDILQKPFDWGTFYKNATYPDAERRYKINALVNPSDSTGSKWCDIVPTLKCVEESYQMVDITATFNIYGGAALQREAEYAATILHSGTSDAVVDVFLNIISADDALKNVAESNYEYYEISLLPHRIDIKGVSNEGVMNGVKTLARLVERAQATGKAYVPSAVICDWPDFHHRGIMLDVARNYTQIDSIKLLIDRLALMKINRLQFHLTDDEGWRIEIPGLPELTQVGGRRGMTETEVDYLCQYYAGNGNANDLLTTSNGYLTTNAFIDFLKYAYAKGVEVIPEIESPGHAGAAIVAMKARYARLISTDIDAAQRYQVWDPDDKSYYTSAQGYHHNVLNPAMEGTYRLMEKVVDQLILMYRQAGVPLPYIHIGGDEVPRDPWSKSPAVARLMAEKGFTTTHEVEEYFITRIADMIASKGVKIGGWQEVATRHSNAVDSLLRQRVAAVNCWNTVADWGGDTISYAVANNGYPVVLCNVGNFYMDMCYDAHEDEPGLSWGGYVDEFRAWDARPYDIYLSSTETLAGEPLDIMKQTSKQPLLPQARKNIIGIQGQLFSETIRNFQMVEYYLFPKVFGLCERAWNAEPQSWQTKALFNRQIADVEFPLLSSLGFNYHLGAPGIKEIDGKIVINSQYNNAEIRYTLDGTKPTLKSTLYTSPLEVPDGAIVRAAIFMSGKSSNATRWEK